MIPKKNLTLSLGVSFGLRKDEGIRANVTVESLGKLKAIRGTGPVSNLPKMFLDVSCDPRIQSDPIIIKILHIDTHRT